MHDPCKRQWVFLNTVPNLGGEGVVGVSFFVVVVGVLLLLLLVRVDWRINNTVLARAYTQAHVCVRVRVCVCVHAHACMHALVCACMHALMCVYMHVCVCVCGDLYERAHTF